MLYAWDNRYSHTQRRALTWWRWYNRWYNMWERERTSFTRKLVIKSAIVFYVREDLTASKRNGNYSNSIVCCSILGNRCDYITIADANVVVSKRNIEWNMSHGVEETIWWLEDVKNSKKPVITASTLIFLYDRWMELKPHQWDSSVYSK